MVERGRQQMTIRRTLAAFWIPKATDTHSDYVTLIGSPRQQRLAERATRLRLCVYCPYCDIKTYNCPLNVQLQFFNLLQPTGHVMYHQFNIQQLYALPTLYLCVLYLSENKQRLVPLTA